MLETLSKRTTVVFMPQKQEETTNRENNRYPPPHRLRAIQVGLGAKEQILFAFCGFPGDDSCTEEEDFDRFAGRQARRDARVVF